MCGRYVSPGPTQVEAEFAAAMPPFAASYNVAPSQAVPALRTVAGAFSGALLRWGLVPFFARGVPPKYSTINARMESLASGPFWRGPWRLGQRCILPARGFYEWQLLEHGRKQPFYIQLADQEIFGFAGLWDRSLGADGQAVESCAIVTLPANALMAQIHNVKQRMPAILKAEDRQTWLTGTGEEAAALLLPYPQELMVAHPVSPRVNSPRNDDPALLEPLPAAQ